MTTYRKVSKYRSSGNADFSRPLGIEIFETFSQQNPSIEYRSPGVNCLGMLLSPKHKHNGRCRSNEINKLMNCSPIRRNLDHYEAGRIGRDRIIISQPYTARGFLKYESVFYSWLDLDRQIMSVISPSASWYFPGSSVLEIIGRVDVIEQISPYVELPPESPVYDKIHVCRKYWNDIPSREDYFNFEEE